MCYNILRKFVDFSVKLLGFVISVIAHLVLRTGVCVSWPLLIL